MNSTDGNTTSPKEPHCSQPHSRQLHCSQSHSPQACDPGPSGAGSGRGAVIASVATLVIIALFISSQMRSGFSRPVEFAVGIGGGLIMAAISCIIVIVGLALLRRLPPRETGIVLGAMIGAALVFTLATTLSVSTFLLSLIVAVPIVAAAALLGGALGFGRKYGFRRPAAIIRLVCTLLFGGAVLFWLVNPGVGTPALSSLPSRTDDDVGSSSPHEGPVAGLPGAAVANPGQPGPYEVGRLHYGSGTNRQRPEYGSDVDVLTPTFDASPHLTEWTGLTGRLRTWYWGFGPDELPINAHVWYPAGERAGSSGTSGDDQDSGPFPLVLIAHGNHRMFEYADPGFAYIGEHLASRGFIVASIDANFLVH